MLRQFCIIKVNWIQRLGTSDRKLILLEQKKTQTKELSGSEYDVFIIALLIKLSLFFLKYAFLFSSKKSHSRWSGVAFCVALGCPNCPRDRRTTSYLSPQHIVLHSKKRLDCRPSKQVATRSPKRATAPRLGWYSLVLTQVVRRVWSQCFRLALDVHAAQTIVPAWDLELRTFLYYQARIWQYSTSVLAIIIFFMTLVPMPKSQ